jgi:hypothetical protein
MSNAQHKDKQYFSNRIRSFSSDRSLKAGRKMPFEYEKRLCELPLRSIAIRSRSNVFNKKLHIVKSAI